MNDYKITNQYMNKIAIMILVSILAISCSSLNSEEIDGKQSDTIQQSIVNASYDYKEQTISVSTKGKEWVFSSIKIDDNVIDIGKQDVLPYSIFGDWFTITRIEKNLFNINLLKNATGKTRNIEIVLADRNFYTRTKISQVSF